jgi:hypothetical protein
VQRLPARFVQHLGIYHGICHDLRWLSRHWSGKYGEMMFSTMHKVNPSYISRSGIFRRPQFDPFWKQTNWCFAVAEKTIQPKMRTVTIPLGFVSPGIFMWTARLPELGPRQVSAWVSNAPSWGRQRISKDLKGNQQRLSSSHSSAMPPGHRQPEASMLVTVQPARAPIGFAQKG